MFKNVGSQKIILLAIDTATGAPKTGDAANLTAYVSKDDGAVTVLGDTSAAELESTNAKGSYSFDLTQSETNADKLYFSGKSSTANVILVPLTVFTRPSGFGDLTIANNAVAANVTRYGGSAGTFSSGRPETNTTHWGGTAVASANVLIDGAITAAKIASDAITSAKVQDGFLTAAKFASGAFDAVWSVATRTLTAFSDSSGVTTLLGKFAGITLVAEWLGLIAGKQTGNSTARTELRATGAGSGTYDETTDSNEALRDNVGTAGAGLTAADDATLAAIAGLNNLSSAQAQTAAAAALTAYDPPTRTEATADKDEILTAVDALPTNAELATALAAADDAVLAAIAALNNLSAAQVTAAVPTATQNADALLKRDFSAVTGEASRSAINALRFLRNKWAIAGATLTVYGEDDTTSKWTGAVTQTAGDPVSEIDPA